MSNVMKLKAKPEYWTRINSGRKLKDYRDAHATFVNTENGKKVTREITGVRIIKRSQLPAELRGNTILFSDDRIVEFTLSEEKRKP